MKKITIFSILTTLLPTTALAQQDSTKQVSLSEVSVTSARQGMIQNRSSLGQLETINRSGLTKMACCTLSSSFENTATTQTSYSDAVTGTRQIQMLGLSGIYTQTMAENIPTLRGLGYAFGWDYTPAAWLDGIAISKGAGTVVNGYEGITGQINLDFRKPNDGQPVYLDFYTDTDLHNELNAVLKHQFSPKLFSGLFLHTTQTTMPNRWHSRMDANDDTFMDMPKVHNYNIYNRWLYADEEHGVQSRLDVRMAYDEREFGQIHGDWHGGTRNLNFQASNKTGISIGKKEGQSLGIINSVTLHGLRTHYGRRTLDADQKSYYGNLIFNSDFGENHHYQVGGGYFFDLIDNHGMAPNTKVSAYGAFAEYTNTAIDKLTLQAGLRADYLLHHGWLITPRLNLKYSPARWLVARLSAGRGHRVANPVVENIGLMASSRQFYIDYDRDETLESAWNVGGNLIFTIPIWNRQEATLSMDYYHVDFGRRLVTDLDTHQTLAAIYADNGKSHTDTWQIDLSMPLFKGMTLYAAWRYTLQSVSQRVHDPRYYYSSSITKDFTYTFYETSATLIPAYKALLNLQYATAMRRWVFDATLQLNGRTRLPGSVTNIESVMLRSEHSPAYALLFAQVTKRFRHFELYVGGENLLSYRQKNPIIGWDDPFGNHFDASQVWAPITGRKIYAGIRLNLGKYM